MEGPSKRPRVPQMAPEGGFGLGMAVESGPQEVDEEDVAEVEVALVDAEVGEDVIVAEDVGEEYALPL